MSTTVRTIIERMDRLTNSVNGNPRYRVVTEHGKANTKTDAGFVYGISPDRLIGVPVYIEYNGNGQITDIFLPVDPA